MFGVSFDELLVVIIVGVFFLNKKDIPELAKFYKSSIKKLTTYKRDIKNNFASIHNEFVSLGDELSEEKTTSESKNKPIENDGFVVSDDGKLHPCFDIEELKSKKK